MAAGSFGWRHYQRWRQTGLIREAHWHREKGDLKNASILARRAVQFDSADVQAVRTLAEIAEAAESANALNWRRRVFELEPENAANAIAVARTALAFRRPTEALAVLARFPQISDPEAMRIRAAANTAQGNLSAAETNLLQLLALEPSDAVGQMNLQLLRLNSSDPRIASSAVSNLLSLSTNSAVQGQALRQLSILSQWSNQLGAALRFSADLLQEEHSFHDELQHLTLLHRSNSRDYAAFLKRMQLRCATNALESAHLARWFLRGGLANDCDAWLASLGEAVRNERPLLIAKAEWLLAARDWAALESHLSERSWEEQNFVRELLLSRAAAERGSSSGRRSHWLKSLGAASGQLHRLVALIQIARMWEWQNEMQDALQAVAARFPDEKWAERQLAESLMSEGDSQALQNLFAKVAEREPRNPIAKSNLASLGLVRDPLDEKWHDLALEARIADPKNPFVAATYAMSLSLKGEDQEALRVLESISPENLKVPEIGVWYGFVLARTGQQGAASTYLTLADRLLLLPEERRLLGLAPH